MTYSSVVAKGVVDPKYRVTYSGTTYLVSGTLNTKIFLLSVIRKAWAGSDRNSQKCLSSTLLMVARMSIQAMKIKIKWPEKHS